MKVIGFNGSPRRDGNTSILIKTVFEELNKEGIETEMIQVGGKDIHGCLACNKCFENKNRQCIIGKDIVNECIAKMIEADGMLLGTPTYFADLTPELKALIDRAGYVMLANGGLLSRKVGAAVVAVRRAGAIHAFDSINHFFTISQMIIPGSSYWNIGFGMRGGETQDDAEGLETMRTLGRNMAWILKCIQAGRKEFSEPQTAKTVLTNFIR
jgi:multimeric flavodoxin WrbA